MSKPVLGAVLCLIASFRTPCLQAWGDSDSDSDANYNAGSASVPKLSSLYMKCLAVNVAAGVLFNLVAGSHLSPLRFVVGVLEFVAAGMLTTYLINTRRLPGVVLQALDRLQQSTPKDLARGLLRVVGEHPALVFGLLAVLAWDQSVPTPDSLPVPAQAIYSATNTVGIFWLVLWTIWKASVDVVVARNLFAVAISFVERFIMLSLALVAVRGFGVELAEVVASVKANPDGALALVAAIIVVRVAFAFAPARGVAATRGVEAPGYAVVPAPRRERSAQDIHRTAVHEAGHLLLFGGRAELPADLAVKVLPQIGYMDLYRGQVTHAGNTPAERTEGYLHWHMLLHLAGSEAEYIALDERADGSCGDNSNWLNAATAYLSSGFGEVFYADPAGDAQLAHNRAVLNDLKARCVREVREFLAANRALLDELAAAIADHKTMNRDQLATYLSRVTAADTLPRAR